MPNIRMPDGQVVRFPDDMPPEQIKSMIASKFPELGAAKQDDSADWYRSTILPVATNQKTGERKWDVPGVIREPYNAIERFMQGGELPPSQNPQLVEDSLVAASVATPINPAMRAGSRAIPGIAQAARREGAAYPAETIKKTAGEQFDDFGKIDLRVKPEAAKGFVGLARQKLLEEGFLEPRATSTYNVLSALEKAPEGGWLSANGIKTVRESLGNVAGDYSNPTDQKAASRAIQFLDEFVTKLPPEGSMAGSAPIGPAQELYRTARGNYAAAAQSKKVAGKLTTAERRAAAANSGGNIDNAIRQRIATLLDNPSQTRGLKQDEIAALEKVVAGGFITNRARDLANLLGAGRGLGGTVTGALAGAAAGDMGTGLLVGAGTIGMGRVMRGVENQLTKRRIRAVDDQIRARAPMGRQQEIAGLKSKSAFVRGVTSQVTTPREESIKHAENVLSSDVLNHIKKSPKTRYVFHDWLSARHNGQNVEEATQMLAGAIIDELNIDDPEVYDRIIRELNDTRGPR